MDQIIADLIGDVVLIAGRCARFVHGDMVLVTVGLEASYRAANPIRRANLYPVGRRVPLRHRGGTTAVCGASVVHIPMS